MGTATTPKFSWRRFFERHGPLLALGLILVGTAVLEAFRVDPESRAFLKPRNLLNIVSQWSYVGIVAVGMTYVIILGGIDLSVGSIVALTGGAAIYAMNAVAAGDPGRAALAILAAVGVCLLAGPILGLINGVLVSVGRIAPFIATLGTMAIYRSAILAPADGSEIRSNVGAFNAIGSGSVNLPGWVGGTPAKLAEDGSVLSPAVPLSVRYPVLAFLAVAVIAHLVLAKTSFGLRVQAIGDNAKAARYAGVRIPRVTAAVYTICGLCCGIAALFNASRLNSIASSSTGLMYELDAIAAVVIGGTRLQGGSGRVFGTVVGVLILGVVGNMLSMLQIPNFYHNMVKGVIILAAVLVQPRKSAE